MSVRERASALDGAQVAREYDGMTAGELARWLDLPQVVIFESVGSTLDAAHALAGEGAPPGTLVLAERQTAGRGRLGRRWLSAAGDGIWLTLVERPTDPVAVQVLSLRLGLNAAVALDPFAEGSVRLKWPNDLHVDRRKLAGILVEARWREQQVDWVAVGMGLNVRPPAELPAAGLRPGTGRLEVLFGLVPALRAAARREGTLDTVELERYAGRDLARGRACRAPLTGVVEGIDRTGALLVRTITGIEAATTGSLVFVEEPC